MVSHHRHPPPCPAAWQGLTIDPIDQSPPSGPLPVLFSFSRQNSGGCDSLRPASASWHHGSPHQDFHRDAKRRSVAGIVFPAPPSPIQPDFSRIPGKLPRRSRKTLLYEALGWSDGKFGAMGQRCSETSPKKRANHDARAVMTVKGIKTSIAAPHNTHCNCRKYFRTQRQNCPGFWQMQHLRAKIFRNRYTSLNFYLTISHRVSQPCQNTSYCKLIVITPGAPRSSAWAIFSPSATKVRFSHVF